MTPPSLACGTCLLETCELAFPPTTAWSVICFLWFLALCVYGRTHGLKFYRIPSPWLGVLLVALAVFVGVSWIGPYAVVPFGIVCVLASWRFLRLAKGLPPAALVAGRAIGASVALALAVSAAWAFVAASGPVTAESVLRYEYNPGAWPQQFEKLRADEPASLPVYREIVLRTCHARLLEEALGRVEALGRPEEEVPRLIDALERRQGERRKREAEIVERFLRRIAGCVPEPDSGTSGWREAWRKKTKGR